MIGIYCTLVKRFERGQMVRRHCVGCVHNTAHLGDEKLYCRYLEYRLSNGAGRLPDSKPSICIPPDIEIKAKLNEKVPDFAAKVAPVYELLRWEWSPEKQEPHIPSVGEIEHALYGLIERLGEDCEDTSMGGLSAYYSMPDEDGPGCYGIAFELEEEVAFDR